MPHVADRYKVEVAKCLDTNPQVCYITDDTLNGMLALYIPNVKNDLTSGQLFAARFFMTAGGGTDKGEYDVYWINLGVATDQEVKTSLQSAFAFVNACACKQGTH